MTCILRLAFNEYLLDPGIILPFINYAYILRQIDSSSGVESNNLSTTVDGPSDESDGRNRSMPVRLPAIFELV